MTPEERAAEEAWVMKHIHDEEPGGLMAIGPRFLDIMFPYPDASQ